MNNYTDLAMRAYQNNRYCFTSFLSMSEFADLEAERGSFPNVKYEAFGGYDGAERKVVRFGNEEDLGYVESYPVVCIRIDFANKKFATQCNHRDYLGSLMGLGLERKCFGDILCDGTGAFVFVLEKNASYILENLASVGRNIVRCKFVDEIPTETVEGQTKEILIQVNSMRVDGIISHIYKLSRKDTLPYFVDKKVAVNGRLVENNDKQLETGDVISVRGHGKFKITESGSITRKGKINVKAEVYV